MIYQQQLPENLHMQMTWQSCMAESRGHFKLRHGNPIHKFANQPYLHIEVETEAHITETVTTAFHLYKTL